MTNKKKIIAIEEFDSAWNEFFEDKPEPKNDEEDKKQQEEFYHWYNFVRKQSDTGKTPAEMYKEIYGKEPPENPIIDNNIKPSRIMNFGWDEEESEEDSDESGMSKLDKELWGMSNEIFDKDIWNTQTKEDMKDLSKKELAKTMFGFGFITHQKVMDEEIKDMEEVMLKDPELSKSIKGFKEKLDKLE